MPGKCANCGDWSERLQAGLDPKCYVYKRRTGRTRPIDIKRGSHREKHHMWKGDAASNAAKNMRARQWYQAGPCEICGGKGERHHKDGDPGNNLPENIAMLCRRHHMAADGRLQRLAAIIPPTLPPKPCTHCNELYKPLRKGLCAKCYMYLRRCGVPRPLQKISYRKDGGVIE